MDHKMKKHLAVSLIELLVTLAIIALLLSISFNTLANVKRENRRQEAHGEIIKLKASIEKMAFTNNSSVIDIVSDASMPKLTDDINTHILAPNEYYRLSISDIQTNAPTGYTINATAVGSQDRDRQCAIISLIISSRREDTQASTDSEGNPSIGNSPCW
jgi:type IV pilus assembly protein PilE